MYACTSRRLYQLCECRSGMRLRWAAIWSRNQTAFAGESSAMRNVASVRPSLLAEAEGLRNRAPRLCVAENEAVVGARTGRQPRGSHVINDLLCLGRCALLCCNNEPPAGRRANRSLT